MPHRALSCYDVLFTVFQHFQSSESSWHDYDPTTDTVTTWYARDIGTANKRSLARCARVSRAFFHPAVALLWRNVDDLSGILALLRAVPLLPKDPDEILIRLPAKQLEQLAHLPEQAARALCYSRHVQTVADFRKKPSLGSIDGGSPAPWWIKGQHLFPQLSHIRWTQLVGGNTDILHVISPSLHSLHLVFRKPPARTDESQDCRAREPFVRDLMRQIVAKAPNLRYLRITTSGEVEESWFESVGELRRLETFDVLEPTARKASTDALLRALAVLPHLQHLRIHLPEAVTFSSALNMFPSLRTLTVDTMFAPLDVVPLVLSSVSSSTLEELIVVNYDCPTDIINKTLHTLTDTIRSKFSRSLRKFSISPSDVGLPPLLNQPLTIEPLFDVHGLEDIDLSIPLEAARPRRIRRAPALTDLALVPRRCPALTELVLPALAASAQMLDTAEQLAAHADFAPLRALRTFALADHGHGSRIADPRRLARCLDALFPAVDWRCPRWPTEAWVETVEELVQLRVARWRRTSGASCVL
ncbi:hypothetical protein C2E23DRAFT_885363 [Lenzites betulinus]|nr:hypothetical protein C2E23DRAFT_885363 [Lenzites betulinus]